MVAWQSISDGENSYSPWAGMHHGSLPHFDRAVCHRPDLGETRRGQMLTRAPTLHLGTRSPASPASVRAPSAATQ
jgi:hypothetical protein